MSQSLPLISIIVPVYKVEKYLSACVQSILAQSYQNIEVILVDDGSPDASPQMCDAFARQDKRVRVIHQSNKGLSGARNAGLDLASGELVGFVDSDDTIDPDMFQVLYDALAAQDADMSLCNYLYVDEKGNRTQDPVNPIRDEVLAGRDNILRKLEEDGNWHWVIACNKLYRKELFQGVRYPLGKVHEDEFVIHQLLLKCSRVACVSRALYFYLKHDSSITGAAFSLKRLDGAEAAFNRAEAFLNHDVSPVSAYHACAVGLRVLSNSYGRLDRKDSAYQQRYRELVGQYRASAKKLLVKKLPLMFKARLLLNCLSPYHTFTYMERFLMQAKNEGEKSASAQEIHMKGTNMQHDYMAYTDNYEKTKHVPSLLVQGDPAGCPEPFFSIVIPTYKRVDFLKIALDSALNQQDAPFAYEVVVVDNDPPGEENSPTQDMLAQYEASNLLYYRNEENLGIAGNWNRCCTLARGQWVALLHDDDILLPDYLQRISRLLNRRQDIGGIMALPFELKEGSTLQEASQKPRSALSRLYDRFSDGRLMRLRRVDSHVLVANPYGAPTCGSVFRRDLLMQSGGFNGDFHPSFDWFFLYRFAGQHKLYRSMERLGYYRVFVNVSLSDITKKAFMQDRVNFVNYAAGQTKTGALMRKLFANEQDQLLYNEPYTDYTGKKPEDFFDPARMKQRTLRKFLFRILTRGYWHTKNFFNVFFG